VEATQLQEYGQGLHDQRSYDGMAYQLLRLLHLLDFDGSLLFLDSILLSNTARQGNR
jgi:hypothetical protein